MSELPRRLAPGTRLTALWLNRLLDWLRARDLRAGEGIRLARTPSGTTISAAGEPDPGKRRYMPFDCRFGSPGDGPARVYCYVPNRSELVKIDGGRKAVPFGGGSPTNDWLDLGPAESVTSVTLYLTTSASASDPREAKIAAARWTVATESPGGTSLGELGPDVEIAAAGPLGLEQRFHGPYLFTDLRVESLDTEQTPASGTTEPGQSVDRYQSTSGTGIEIGPIQLRAFANASDTLSIQAMGATGSLPDVRNLQILFRQVGTGTAGATRPKLCYVATTNQGPFWVTGSDSSVNYGTAFKLGTPQDGYITFSTSAPT